MARVVGAKTAADREIPTATLARLHTPWERTQADAATQAEKNEPLRPCDDVQRRPHGLDVRVDGGDLLIRTDRR